MKILGNASLMRFPDRGLAMLRLAPSGRLRVNLILPARRLISLFFSFSLSPFSPPRPPFFIITPPLPQPGSMLFKIPPLRSPPFLKRLHLHMQSFALLLCKRTTARLPPWRMLLRCGFLEPSFVTHVFPSPALHEALEFHTLKKQHSKKN